MLTVLRATGQSADIACGSSGRRTILDGFDTNRAIMYRKLMLWGNTCRSFDRVYVFTETLAAIEKIPAVFPREAAG